MSPDSNSLILRLSSIGREVSASDGTKTIIDSFSFDFREGEIYSIVGPSGSGKSSLLRLCNRLDEKTSGNIQFNGNDAYDMPVTQLRRKIALVFQIPFLFPGTVKSNLTLCCDSESSIQESKLQDLLNRVGLDSSFLTRSHDKLSVGQQQRVALARSLYLEPDILLLDEPTSALDPGAARTIEDLILDLNNKLKLTIIMVTHNFGQAVRLGGTSLFIVDGRLVESGRSFEMFENPQNEMTRRFIAGELR